MIFARASPGEVRVACVAEGVLEAFSIWRPGRPDGIGDVYRARVVAHVPGMAGAFVSLAGDEDDGFLPDSEGGAGAVEGALVTVRVTRAGLGGKGKRVSARVAQEEGGAGLMARGPSPLEELAARYPEAPIVADDPGLAASLKAGFAARVSVGAGPPAAVLEAIEGLGEVEAGLPGGMRASFHPTPALVAIDLDMAGATGAGRGKASAQVAANLAAIPALARQIRLRNLSGAILVDPAGVSIKRRALLRPAFEAALAGDALQPRLVGLTGLGLVEILRPRLRPPLHELLSGPHAAGIAALRALAREAAATPAVEFGLVAAPDVVRALEGDPAAVADLARRTGRALMMRPEPALSPGSWRIERPI